MKCLAMTRCLAMALTLAAAGRASLFAADVSSADFARDVEPIFIKRCYECHGPDKQKSELRLDLKADAMHGGKSGKPAIVPGKSGDSEIIARVTSSDPDEVMPSKGDRLTPEQIAALRAWIDAGAVWPEKDPKKHWAFITPVRRRPPAVKNTRWIANDIDRFILARLEQEGLAPMPEADRATLIRRLSLDLTGLPPTIEEVDAFLKDRSSDAYEKLVDRLLASPHYGEHIARGWLDLARYADSNGYQVDPARSMWPYREWVINAFNDNMPFDQFTIEQLAGDLLAERHAGAEDRHRLQPQHQDQRRGRRRRRGISDQGGEGPRRHHGDDLAGPDDDVRRMSHAQVRPDLPRGLLPVLRVLQQHRRRRQLQPSPSVAVPAPPLRAMVNYLHDRARRSCRQELAEAEKQSARRTGGLGTKRRGQSQRLGDA